MDPRNDEPFDRAPWRRMLDAGSGAPAHELDQRILAEARRALAPRAGRWCLPASLAASVLLAVLLVQWQLEESGAPGLVTESDVLPAPLPASEDEQPAAASPPVETPQRQSPPAKSPARAAAPPEMESRPPADTARPPMPMTATQESGLAHREPAVPEAATDAPVTTPVKTESARVLGKFGALRESAESPRTPEDWYAEIEALRAAGRWQEAEAELERLEEAYPGWLERRRQQNP